MGTKAKTRPKAAALNDASPLHRFRSTIRRMCRDGATPAEIADELSDLYPAANATEDAVLLAISAWGFDRVSLPAGHSIPWGAITAGTTFDGSPYTVH